MASRIEDYALISDRLAAGWSAATGRSTGCASRGSTPRRSSRPCSAPRTTATGGWRRRSGGTCTSRRYRGDTMVLETEWAGPDGTVRVIDFMPERDEAPDVVRIVEGVSGQVAMRSELRLRFGYGDVIPWVRHLDGMLAAVAGPDAVWLASDVAHHGRDFASYADFTVEAGQRESFVLTWNPSYQAPAAPRSTRWHALDDDRAVLADLVRPVHLRRALPRGRPAVAAHPQGADLRADRRHRRGRDDLAAGGARRRAQLGLPVLLAARRRVHPAGAGQDRLHRGGRRVAGVAAARDRRQPGPAADPLRRGRRAARPGARAALAARATRGPRRSGSATARSTSSSSTSTAR